MGPGARWGLETPELERVRAHPAFLAGFLTLTRQQLALHKNRPLLNQLINDRGRLVLSSLALALHYDLDGEGLTVARAQAKMKAMRVGSPGRVAAILSLLRWGGLVRPAAPGRDRRVNRLEPTEALITIQRERWRNGLEAVAHVFPEAQDAADRLDHPLAFAAMARAQARPFLDGFRFVDVIPGLETLFDRNHGLVFAFDRVANADATPTASGLARRYGMSRAHASALLRDFCEEGRLKPELRRGLELFAAALFLINAACARETLAALEAAPGAAPTAAKARVHA
jgi:hypothetical protein